MTQGKSFNNRPQTQTAIDTCGWVAPPYVNVGAGRHVSHATIGTPILAEPTKMRAAKHGPKWCALGTGVPSLEGEEIDPDDDVERGRDNLPPQAQAQGAQSGIVERPGAQKKESA